MYSLNGSDPHDIADNHLVSTASTSVESPFIQNLRRLFPYLSSDEACFDEPRKSVNTEEFDRT